MAGQNFSAIDFRKKRSLFAPRTTILRYPTRRRYRSQVTSSAGKRLGEKAAHRLAQSGPGQTGSGLTDAELARIERDYEFEFADDHRAFLAAGLPLNAPPEQGQARPPDHARQQGQTRREPWPDWRGGDPAGLRGQLDWPIEGALFDVEHNDLWLPAWGHRPSGTDEALDTARRHLTRAPKMIPVYGHRYLPAGRGTHGHPVLSIYQTDIIVYGIDLADYIDHEFGGSGWSISADWTPPPMVRFWSDFL
jgi:hypothetical protein